MGYSRKDLQRNKLYVTFVGEEGWVVQRSGLWSPGWDCRADVSPHPRCGCLKQEILLAGNAVLIHLNLLAFFFLRLSLVFKSFDIEFLWYELVTIDHFWEQKFGLVFPLCNSLSLKGEKWALRSTKQGIAFSICDLVIWTGVLSRTYLTCSINSVSESQIRILVAFQEASPAITLGAWFLFFCPQFFSPLGMAAHLPK